MTNDTNIRNFLKDLGNFSKPSNLDNELLIYLVSY